jgi:hypothetical protein
MNTNPRFFNATTDAEIADELGALRAEIDELRKAATFLEDLLKHKHVEEAEGALFRVKISYDVRTKKVNWKEVAAKLEPSRQLIQAHTSISTSDRVLVTAKKKDA